MFVRKKKNKSSVISIQVISKQNGKSKLIKTIGSSSDKAKIKRLFIQGKKYIENYKGQQTITFSDNNFNQTIANSIQSIDIEGVNLLLGKIYTDIGFNKLNSELLKQLVLIRLSHPASKLKTTQHLKRYFSVDINEDKIYR